jgi:hypothetical protein
MSLRKYAAGLLFTAVATAGIALAATQQDQSPKQDMKDAGHATQDAARDTGRATKKTGHAVKKTTKKAANKTARKTKEGSQKVEDKTRPN